MIFKKMGLKIFMIPNVFEILLYELKEKEWPHLSSMNRRKQDNQFKLVCGYILWLTIMVGYKKHV